MKPNNITRLLDSHHIAYEAFELPAEKLGALETAQILGVSAEEVFKTIVVLREGKGKPLLAITPGPLTVDLKALAKIVGEKKLLLATEKEAEHITGLQAGGISPLALLNRPFQVVIDESALLFDAVYISGGQRGLNIRLSLQALADLTQAQIGDFAR